MGSSSEVCVWGAVDVDGKVMSFGFARNKARAGFNSTFIDDHIGRDSVPAAFRFPW